MEPIAEDVGIEPTLTGYFTPVLFHWANLPNLFFENLSVDRVGFEPTTSAPKTDELPITPSVNVCSQQELNLYSSVYETAALTN